MSSVTVEVTGKDGLAAKLDPTRVQGLMREGLLRGLIDLQTVIKLKLSGPVLKNQTNNLRSSINYRITDDGTGMDGVVGSFAGYPNPKGGEQAAGYARINEFGGTFQIPEHERRVTQIFGKQVEPFMQTVRAHSATYPERSFLRSSLAERKDNITKELKFSMDQALSGA